MLILGIAIGAVSAIGISKTVHSVVTDGSGRVPTRTYPNAFNLR